MSGVIDSRVINIDALQLEHFEQGTKFFSDCVRVGPLIGARTWGGLVKSSVHTPLWTAAPSPRLTMPCLIRSTTNGSRRTKAYRQIGRAHV